MILRWLALSVVLAIGLTDRAHAQFAPNSGEPIRGSADAVSYAGDTAIFTGQVDVRQGDVRILSETMTVFSANSGQTTDAASAFSDVRRIEAVGDFFYITPTQTVTGAQGIYTGSDNSFTVTGDVIFVQDGENIVTGDRLVYDLTTETARIVGTCQGRACGSTGRVNILLKTNDEDRQPNG